MVSVKELLEEEIPFLKLDDMTPTDWQDLDTEIKRHENDIANNNLQDCPLLRFTIQQLQLDPVNFNKVPELFRNDPQFQRVVAKGNKRLERILFPKDTEPTPLPTIHDLVVLLRGKGKDKLAEEIETAQEQFEQRCAIYGKYNFAPGERFLFNSLEEIEFFLALPAEEQNKEIEKRLKAVQEEKA